MSATPDRILLDVPADAPYRHVATLVLGGVGGRLELPYERSDDLQLAVLSALESALGPSARIEMEASDGALSVLIGPLVAGAASDRSLAAVLEKLVEAVEGDGREDGDWITLRVSRPSS